MKLSIIIPVYGVEKYILEFAESLFPQLNDGVEVIIINDGTKDNSIQILKKYLKENFVDDRNILWLEQENQGQSVARNYGIKEAKGNYITFLDPDDYVKNNYISEIFKAIESGVDLIQFNALVFNQDKNNIVSELKLTNNNDGSYSNNDSFNEMIFQKSMWFCWLRIFKRSLINEDFFPKGVNYQDMMALPDFYLISKNIYNICLPLVVYRVHQGSAVHKPNFRLVKSANMGLNIFKEQKGLKKIIYKKFLLIYMESVINLFNVKNQVKQIYVDRNSISYTYYFFVFYLFLFFNFKRNIKIIVKYIKD